MRTSTLPNLAMLLLAPMRDNLRLKLPFFCLLAAVGLWFPAISQGQAPIVIDDFMTDDELTVTSGAPLARGEILPIGTVELPSNPEVDIARQLALEINDPSIPAAAAIIKNSPLVLLTAGGEGQVGGKLTLRYSGPEDSPLNAPFTGTTGLRVHIRTFTQFQLNVTLCPVNGTCSRKWTTAKVIFPGDTVIDMPWTAFTQFGNNPGAPDGEPILVLVIDFNMTHLEDTPLIIEGVELIPSAAPPSATLNVTIDAEPGCNGMVRSSPAGIDCGQDCSETFPPSVNSVTLQATTTRPGCGFQAWSGTSCLVVPSGQNPISIPMDRDRECTAEFVNSR